MPFGMMRACWRGQVWARLAGSIPDATTSAREGYPSTDCCGVVVKEKLRFGGPARRSRQRHGCREPTLVTSAHGAAEVLP